MKKNRNILYCDFCRMNIEKFGKQSWKDILNKAGWKHCEARQWTDSRLLCNYCAYDFEERYNIDHKTGLQKI